MRLGNPGLAVDSADMENGRWINIPEFGGNVRLKLASMRCRAYREAASARRLAELEGDQLEVASAETLADHIVKDWSGLVDTSGSTVPYSPQTCRAILLNPDNRRLTIKIVSLAADLSSYDVTGGVTEADAKN